MRFLASLLATALPVAFVSAQNLLPNGHFDLGATGWTLTQFNDPLGSTGFAPARVRNQGPSDAVFADFYTLTPVMSATFRSGPFTLPAGAIPVSFAVMFEKQVTTPIPSPTVNRVELRIYDAGNVRIFLGTQNAPNQSGLFERAVFQNVVNVVTTGTYEAELFLRHSNLAGIPFKLWVDDVVLGTPSSNHYGSGCAGSGGFVPVLGTTNGAVVPSNNFAITLHDALANAVALFAMDLSDTQWAGGPLPFALGGGCSLYNGGGVLNVHFTQGTGAGDGTASQSLVIPNNPRLAGMRLFAQWGVLDGAVTNPFGVATTAGFTFLVQ